MIRALKVIDGIVYGVVDDEFVRILDDPPSSLGSLVTSAGAAWIESNGIDIAVADGYHVYVYDVSEGSFTQIDVPAGNGITFLNGYLLSGGTLISRYVYASGGFDALTWDGLAFGSVETTPGNLLLPVSSRDVCLMMCDDAIEIWQYTGDGTKFPFALLPGPTARYGLAAIRSIADLGGVKVALLRSNNGQLIVGAISGYEVASLVERQPAVAAEWLSYESVSDAIGTSYSIGEYNIYQISFPTANKTWAYESKTGIWVRLETNQSRYVGELSVSVGNTVYISDRSDGELHQLDVDAVMDGDMPIFTEIISNPIKGYSTFHVVPKVTLDVAVGTTPFLPGSDGYDPKITLSMSGDGGNTWKPSHTLSIGHQGEYQTRVTARRLGRGKDIVIKVSGAGLYDAMPVQYAISSQSEIEIL